jgi:hypothetical protein
LVVGSLGHRQGFVGDDRPDEPGRLAGARDGDLLRGLAAAGDPLPAAVQALLGAPGTLEDGGVLVASSMSTADR